MVARWREATYRQDADWRESDDGHLLIDTYVRCTRIHEIMTLLAEVRRNLGL